ncbi:hypothetical protein [Flexithrix dorotheae]|uniref:hypothetical protein n=1 Tax=Flexithrix dorotheae TaxID=70993 RepID=UPI000381CD52|nr:hypothetical protein [Flexithrix dorotheae]
MKYANFNTEDFLTDEGFQNFIFHSQKKGLWINFLLEYPEKLNDFMEAAQLLKNLKFVPQKPSILEKNQDTQKIKSILKML